MMIAPAPLPGEVVSTSSSPREFTNKGTTVTLSAWRLVMLLSDAMITMVLAPRCARSGAYHDRRAGDLRWRNIKRILSERTSFTRQQPSATELDGRTVALRRRQADRDWKSALAGIDGLFRARRNAFGETRDIALRSVCDGCVAPQLGSNIEHLVPVVSGIQGITELLAQRFCGNRHRSRN